MFAINGYDHVGIRVSNKAEAEAFYAKLGFFPEEGEHEPEYEAIGLINQSGVRVNLIYNAIKTAERKNILIDVESHEKLAGITHPAFVVEDLDKVIQILNNEGISITEGPIETNRRRMCFIRDPDKNVLEFDELI